MASPTCFYMCVKFSPYYKNTPDKRDIVRCMRIARNLLDSLYSLNAIEILS